MTKTLTDTRPIRLKGRSFLALVLAPELPFDAWLTRLDDLAARSTGFFLGRPIVLDVEGLDIDQPQLKELIGELGERSVRIMGIEGARASLLGFGMPPAMKGGRPAADFEPPVAESAPKKTESTKSKTASKPATAQAPDPQPVKAMPSIIITEPVRSGQSVIFPEGDVTILGSVASGSEVVAGGSIHVYGTLRGRAMAGSVGNASARIFCRKLEAELVAIDGLYKTAEDMEPTYRGQAVQVWLEGDTIKAEILG
ncbi:septum site-determining protein MinC [Aurantimonas sp. C2-6-R+9]|uniref:septum site-determining protein MinC n=1 Tax=unclassified Aurantimonas TaxID=2638230 RepID=UPI002E19204A|nr:MULTISPECIES: septum site-determining protein MinC [unclassified Aurantimonas]MEC5289188.1 septum site-determining protein MinC [Aurantimonas sp. C2-3-R2]MEC5380176.1 septum site-determining protein MinC [Aurantimonas sp. C2-6-R+9]MEC5410362.1 septum site-determining protein MinC [Aurantimonas sp. C2-4-R8]